MKTLNHHQHGFFDLGVGFALLSLMGLTAVAVLPDEQNVETELASCTKVVSQQHESCYAVDK